jgi:hypothetical protein
MNMTFQRDERRRAVDMVWQWLKFGKCLAIGETGIETI